jgi:hypothetical protein
MRGGRNGKEQHEEPQIGCGMGKRYLQDGQAGGGVEARETTGNIIPPAVRCTFLRALHLPTGKQRLPGAAVKALNKN